MIDLELDDEPYSESDLEGFRERGLQIERTGESWMRLAWCEGEIEKLQAKREQFVAAIDRAAKKNPNDLQIPRGASAVAEIDAELSAFRMARLRVTPTNRRYPN